LNKLEFPSPKDNMHQIWLILACWFWRTRFLKMFSVFLLFCYYRPFVKDDPFNLKKKKWIFFPKNDFFRVWLKLAQWFWRRSLNDTTPIFTFLWLSPLWRGPGPLFEQACMFFTQRWFVLKNLVRLASYLAP
jgi:hypothetical protein